MTFKKLGRIACVVALSGMALAVPFMSGCNTNHPEAKITIEFNGSSYVLEYKMYRNMYPQTVKHFIELADQKFYNNTIIHNYQTSYWYGGGYAYEESGEEGDVEGSYSAAYEQGANEIRDYLDAVSKEKAYETLAKAGKLTPSVYKNFINGEYSQPLDTLIGEFSNNQHKIKKGALRGSFGALRMYYSSKTDDKAKDRVYLDKTGSAAGVMGEYRYNSTTSLFSIQTSTSTSSDSSYCIFATLKNSDVLTKLRTAVRSKITSDNTTAVKLYVDNYDDILDANTVEATYTVTSTPIIVKSVVITKY